MHVLLPSTSPYRSVKLCIASGGRLIPSSNRPNSFLALCSRSHRDPVFDTLLSSGRRLVLCHGRLEAWCIQPEHISFHAARLKPQLTTAIMHPHLHTKDNTSGPAVGCEDVMTALDECHARGFLWSSMGMCNDAKHKVNMCLRAARLERQAINREKARQERARMKALFDEIDQNS
ncbi:hypothetical protein FH972_026016 [Carpinus fangiana]|uniref:COX assembly mitochondrial protein n=1 Tax=Carpinus fangiana TaxID=176857 RepID=A0A5N6L389_9ROSI|nr:hypothetical protein FH972_026016 [Carpinus fangiana]